MSHILSLLSLLLFPASTASAKERTESSGLEAAPIRRRLMASAEMCCDFGHKSLYKEICIGEGTLVYSHLLLEQCPSLPSRRCEQSIADFVLQTGDELVYLVATYTDIEMIVGERFNH